MSKYVTFGEIMLRLKSPDKMRFMQVPEFEATFGGGEANVAVGLANLGMDTAYISVIPKNAMGDACVREVRKYGVNTDLIVRKGERLYRELGKELTLDCLVFAYPDGRPLDPSVLSHEFARLAKQAGLERVRFHDLRHTFASLMLMRGAKPKVISEALGHASVGFTMDVYSHIIEGMQADAMALLDEVLPEGVVKNSVANSSPTLDFQR